MVPPLSRVVFNRAGHFWPYNLCPMIQSMKSDYLFIRSTKRLLKPPRRSLFACRNRSMSASANPRMSSRAYSASNTSATSSSEPLAKSSFDSSTIFRRNRKSISSMDATLTSGVSPLFRMISGIRSRTSFSSTNVRHQSIFENLCNFDLWACGLNELFHSLADIIGQLIGPRILGTSGYSVFHVLEL